jgi:hypothetical protein
MGRKSRVRILAVMGVGAAALGGASCGGRSGTSGGARDGGGAGDGSDGVQCPSSGGLTAEPLPRQVALDGGVPIDQLTYALAVARCNYMSRCFALSTYVANECVDSVTNNQAWAYQVCQEIPLGLDCTTMNDFYPFPSAALLRAVAAGVVRYDAQMEAQCIAALLAEGCVSYPMIENLPACVGVFTCASTADGGDSGPTDGSAADGGSACSQLITNNTFNQPVPTCSTDADCAGVTGYPDCVAGICAASPCGLAIAGCTSFAAAGQPCNSNALSLRKPLSGLPPFCGPGLACQGETADGGIGTCVVPLDVSGTCTDDSNCKPGLTCACGTCEIPPSTGACVNGLCQVGVAYCDTASNVCRPVRQSGASCADAINSCGPGLVCNSGLCGPPI